MTPPLPELPSEHVVLIAYSACQLPFYLSNQFKSSFAPNSGLEVAYEVLVDSGADICIFDAHIVDILGIDVTKRERRSVSGLTGFPEFYYLHNVTIKVGGLEYKAEVGFMSMRDNAYGIVGQKGFFSKFIVKFDLQKEDIEIKPR